MARTSSLWFTILLSLNFASAADAPGGVKPVMRTRVSSHTGQSRIGTTRVYINGRPSLTTTKTVEGEIIVPGSCNVSRLKLTREHDAPADAPAGKAARTERQKQDYSLPPLPGASYEQHAKDLEAIAAMSAVPLAWQASGELAPESADRIRQCRKTWREKVALQGIRVLQNPGLSVQDGIKLEDLPFVISKRTSPWTPAIPGNANREAVKAACGKVSAIMDRLGRKSEPGQTANRDTDWKSLGRELQPLVALFREYSNPRQMWSLAFTLGDISAPTRLRLSEGDTLISGTTFQP